MRKMILTTILSLLIFPATGHVFADSPFPTPEASLNAEIQNLLDHQADRLLELGNQRLASAPTEALELDREISAVKRRTEISILTAQLRYAESQGKGEMARSLERTIAILKDPKPLLTSRAALYPRPTTATPVPDPAAGQGGAK